VDGAEGARHGAELAADAVGFVNADATVGISTNGVDGTYFEARGAFAMVACDRSDQVAALKER